MHISRKTEALGKGLRLATVPYLSTEMHNRVTRLELSGVRFSGLSSSWLDPPPQILPDTPKSNRGTLQTGINMSY